MVIDRRRDAKADTGLFELVYRQNLPQSPAYLGMMLSIKGKKVFKKRSPNEEKRPKKSSSASPERRRYTTGTLSPRRDGNMKEYKGPIIENLIEEIHDTLFKSSNPNEAIPDIEIVAENKPITEKRPKLQEFHIFTEKNAIQEKRHRVQEFQILTDKTSSMPNILNNKNSSVNTSKSPTINKKPSFPRKTPDLQKETTPVKKKCTCTAKSNPTPTILIRASPKPERKKFIPYVNKNWEQETASILKNTICLSSAPVNCKRYRSKSFIQFSELKNNAALNSNNLLPNIDIKNSPMRRLSSNLLTVGTTCSNTLKPFSKENILSLSTPVIDNGLKVKC